MKPTPEPWERQYGESKQAVEGFRIYRDLGPKRTLEKTSVALGKSAKLMADWSAKWSWIERAAAWDDERDRLARLDQVEEVREMHRRHAELATTILDKVQTRLVGSSEAGIEALKPEDLTVSEMARLADVAVKIERLARGEPETVVATTPPGEQRPDEYRAVGRLMADEALVAEAEALAAKLFEETTPDRHLRAVGA